MAVTGDGAAKGDLEVEAATTIVGAGLGTDGAPTTTIDACGIDRIFRCRVADGIAVRRRDLTGQAYGRLCGDGSNGGGGTFFLGRNGHVLLTDAVVDNSTSALDGGAAVLVYLSSLLRTERVRFENTTASSPPGDAAFGGAIYATKGSVIIDESTFRNTRALAGANLPGEMQHNVYGGAINIVNDRDVDRDAEHLRGECGGRKRRTAGRCHGGGWRQRPRRSDRHQHHGRRHDLRLDVLRQPSGGWDDRYQSRRRGRRRRDVVRRVGTDHALVLHSGRQQGRGPGLSPQRLVVRWHRRRRRHPRLDRGQEPQRQRRLSPTWTRPKPPPGTTCSAQSFPATMCKRAT